MLSLQPPAPLVVVLPPPAQPWPYVLAELAPVGPAPCAAPSREVLPAPACAQWPVLRLETASLRPGPYRLNLYGQNSPDNLAPEATDGHWVLGLEVKLEAPPEICELPQNT